MKKLIPTVLAVGVFIGLLIWIRVGDFGGRIDPEETLSAEEEVWQVKSDEITALSVERAVDTVAFSKEKDHWLATAPQKFPTSDVLINSFAATLAGLKGEPMKPEKGNKAEFGLDQPQATVKLTLKGGNTALCYVGAEAPVGDKQYVQIENDETIYAVGKTAIAKVFDAPEVFMDKTIWTVNKDTVRSLTLTWGGDTYTLNKRNDAWQLNNKKLSEDDAMYTLSLFNILSAEGLPVTRQPEKEDFHLTIVTDEGTDEWLGGLQDDSVLIWNEDREWIYPLAMADLDNAVKQIAETLTKTKDENE